MWTDVTMADPNADIDTIEDEDLLKQMWQATEDFADKRRIRARMYKLREKRLKDFYTSDDVMSTSTPPSATENTTTTTTSTSSSRRTSSSFTSSSTSSNMMETDETPSNASSTKRRISGMNTTTLLEASSNSEAGNNKVLVSAPEDPVVSEKIRRKSSVRTQRLQKVLNEIERPMSPDSAASSAVVMTTSSSTSTSSSSRRESRSGNLMRDDQEQQNNKPAVASTNGTSQWPMAVKDDDEQQMVMMPDSACSYEELKSSSSVREWTEGDILTIVEIRETWRKVREAGSNNANSAPVTQRVTLTKTIRKRLSDGVLLEENEDEVIDDIEDGEENLQPMTAIDAALRRSSLVSLNSVSSQQNISSSSTTARPASPEGVPVIEERIAAKRTFSTGLSDSNQDNQGAGSDVDSLDGQAPEPSVTTTRNITSSSSSTKRSTITSSNTPSKTTSSVTKRSDSGQIRSSPANSTISRPGASSSSSRNTTITSSSVTSNNRSTGSTNIPAKKSALPVSKTTSSSSISSRTTPSTPKKKISDASSTTDGADVAEFIRLEAEIKQKSAAPVTTNKVTTTTTKSVTSSATSGLRKPGASTAPLMTRTIETTRIVRAKDDPEDKPWRQNSKPTNSGSNTPNRVATSKATAANKDKGALHSNVLTVLEKYVETDGCAIHGCCDHHEPEEVAAAPAVEVSTKSSRTTNSKSTTSTSQWNSPSKQKEPEVEPTTTAKDMKSRLKLSMSPAVNTTVAGAKTAGSPMLDSPSVVKKARSLFHHSDSSEALSPAPSSPKVSTNVTTSTVRSSFESSTNTAGSSSPLPALKREGTKVWESTAIKKPEENTVKARSPSPPKSSATATVDVTTKVIEDIEDLTLLENMLNTATNYDDRSRIRAHIRTVKKQMGLTVTGSSPMVTRKTIPSPSSASPAESPKVVAPASPLIPRANPVQKEISTTKSSESTVIRRAPPAAEISPKPLIPEISQQSESTVIRRTSTITTETSVVSSSSTKETETSSGGSSPRNSVQRSNSAAWRRQPSDGNLLAKSASSSSTHLPEDSSITTNPETLDITSSYGTGPMDEFGRPLFGLGALRRKKAPSSITDSDAAPASPQPIIIERSQTLTELQKLHEQQTIQASKEPESTLMTEKPRLKLRDSFTFGISTDQTESSNSETPGSSSPEPIIGERSAALREIIRIHESTVQQASEEEQQIPTSPAPKAKLKDSFILPSSEPSTPDDEEDDDDRTIDQRSESFQTIVKRHQEQISSNPAAPVKRPGILKKPKDWSPTPTSSQSSTTSSTVVQETTSTTTSSNYTRKPSIESSIEIQLNPVQSSSIVVHEIPASGLKDSRRNSSSVTIEYNSIQDVKVDGGERRGSQQTRKLSIDVEASPTMHTTSMTLPTSSSSSSTSSYVTKSNTNKTSTAGLKLTGDSSGHTIRNTSTFQVTKTSNNTKPSETDNSGSTTSSSFMLTGLAALRKKPAATEVIIENPNSSADPTPWRKKSIPSTEEPSSALKENNNDQMQSIKSTSSMTNGISTTTNKTSSYRSSLNSNNNNKYGSVGSRAVSTVNPLEESTTINRTSSVVRKLPQYQVTETKTTTTVTSNRNSGLPATSVRALAQKFITTGEEKSQPQVSKSASYPRAGLIFRSNSFRSQTSPERRISGSGLNTEGGASPGSPLSRSESLRSSPGRTIQQRYTTNSVQETSIPDGSGAGSRRESSSVVTSTVSTRSFLQDRTPVRGMQDIIGRMSATPTSAVVGQSEEDARSLSLLNKLIGAQILVQSTEAALSGLEQHPDAKITSSNTTSEELSPDGSRLSRTVKSERSGSLVQSGLDEGTGASWTSRRTSSSTSTRTASIQGSDNAVMSQNGASCIVDGVDINSVDDDFKLNELLDNCNDYEGRRKIRARIKALLGDSKVTTSTRTTSSNIMRSSGSQPGNNAFSKFQQLDQSVKTTTTRVVRWGNASGGGATSTTPAGLVRTASGIKDFLLQWCQARTRDYQKVQIENFSTSWNDGLAFCALIHRFYPDAFDFDKLESKNRRYNFTLAFQTAEERAGIAPLLDVDDMVAMQRPDWKCVFTYVQSFYRRFKDEC